MVQGERKNSSLSPTFRTYALAVLLLRHNLPVSEQSRYDVL